MLGRQRRQQPIGHRWRIDAVQTVDRAQQHDASGLGRKLAGLSHGPLRGRAIARLHERGQRRSGIGVRCAKRLSGIRDRVGHTLTAAQHVEVACLHRIVGGEHEQACLHQVGHAAIGLGHGQQRFSSRGRRHLQRGGDGADAVRALRVLRERQQRLRRLGQFVVAACIGKASQQIGALGGIDLVETLDEGFPARLITLLEHQQVGEAGDFGGVRRTGIAKHRGVPWLMQSVQFGHQQRAVVRGQLLVREQRADAFGLQQAKAQAFRDHHGAKRGIAQLQQQRGIGAALAGDLGKTQESIDAHGRLRGLQQRLEDRLHGRILQRAKRHQQRVLHTGVLIGDRLPQRQHGGIGRLHLLGHHRLARRNRECGQQRSDAEALHSASVAEAVVMVVQPRLVPRSV